MFSAPLHNCLISNYTEIPEPNIKDKADLYEFIVPYAAPFLNSKAGKFKLPARFHLRDRYFYPCRNCAIFSGDNCTATALHP